MLTCLLLLLTGVSTARLPYCAWCRYEDDVDALFARCWEHADPRIMLLESRCHDAWRHHLATALVTHVEPIDSLGDAFEDFRLLMTLRGGARAAFRPACNRASEERLFYKQLVAHQVDRALSFHRTPAIQTRTFALHVLLALPSIDAATRRALQSLVADCPLAGDNFDGILVGLPPAQVTQAAPPFAVQLDALADAGVAQDSKLELLRHLMFVYVVGNHHELTNATRHMLALRRAPHVDDLDQFRTVARAPLLLSLDALQSNWADGGYLHDRDWDTANDDEPLARERETFMRSLGPTDCNHASLSCTRVNHDALRGALPAKTKASAAVPRYIGRLLRSVCAFPSSVARRLESLHTDSVKVGVYLAHQLRSAVPDADAGREDAWREATDCACV